MDFKPDQVRGQLTAQAFSARRRAIKAEIVAIILYRQANHLHRFGGQTIYPLELGSNPIHAPGPVARTGQSCGLLE
jgi:hypothetical protein